MFVNIPSLHLMNNFLILEYFSFSICTFIKSSFYKAFNVMTNYLKTQNTPLLLKDDAN